jgi:hypothetical protein
MERRWVVSTMALALSIVLCVACDKDEESGDGGGAEEGTGTGTGKVVSGKQPGDKDPGGGTTEIDDDDQDDDQDDDDVIVDGDQSDPADDDAAADDDAPADDDDPPADDDDDGDDEPVVTDPIELTVDDPTLRRRVFVDDEAATATGTISFSHNGDSVECSSDGGLTYGACATPSTLAWTIADRDSVHTIKVTKAGAPNSPYVHSITPSGIFADIEVVTCTTSVTTNIDFTALNALLTGGQVVCIADGVTIANDDTLDQASIKPHTGDVIIAREADTVTVSSSRSSNSSHIFEWWIFPNGNDSRVVGLDVLYTGDNFASSPFYVTWSTGVLINDCTVHSSGEASGLVNLDSATAKVIGVTMTSPSGTPEGLKLSDSTVEARELDVQTASSAVAVGNSGSLFVHKSKLESSAYAPVNISSSGLGSTTVTLSETRVINDYVDTWSSAVNIDASSGETDVILADVEIFTKAGGISAGASDVSSSLSLDRVTIAHLAAGQTNDFGILVGWTSGHTGFLMAAADGVRVCHQGPGSHVFDRFLDESFGDPQTGFTVANQRDDGAILECPASLVFP